MQKQFAAFLAVKTHYFSIMQYIFVNLCRRVTFSPKGNSFLNNLEIVRATFGDRRLCAFG